MTLTGQIVDAVRSQREVGVELPSGRFANAQAGTVAGHDDLDRGRAVR